MKILYRCHADYLVWVEKAGYKQVFNHSKDVVRDTIKEHIGLMLGYVCSAGGKGGIEDDEKAAVDTRFVNDHA